MKTKYKINLIVPSFYPALKYGGPIFSTLNLCKQLSKLGHQVLVSTTDVNGKERLDVTSNQIIKFEGIFKVTYYKTTFSQMILDVFSLSLVFGLWKDIKKSDVALVQGIFSFTTPLTLIYSILLQKVCIITPRGALGSECIGMKNSFFKRLWLKLLIAPFCKNVYWHTTALQETTEVKSIFPNAKTFIAPNGISLEDFTNLNHLSPSNYTQKFIGKKIDSKNIIISLGRINDKKGFDILIDSFQDILNEFSDAILLIAGPDGGSKDKLLSQINKQNLTKSVYLINPIEGQDKVDFLSNAKLFVLPSHNENFGIVYAEALICKTPIIASLKTPWQDVEENECGLWVENSSKSTSNAIKTLLRMDCQALGENGYTYIKNNFTWDAVAKKFDNELSIIMNSK